MRALTLAVALFLAVFAEAARAQSCPGVTPWVFDDVEASDPFCGFVTFMATSGVTTGCTTLGPDNRLYCPEGVVTRKQMAAFMGRLASNAVFAEGGNSFGAPAVLGTRDNHPLDVHVNGVRALRLSPGASTPSILAGHPNNSIGTFSRGQAVLGGGAAGDDCATLTVGPRSCANHALGSESTIAGGVANRITGSNSLIGAGILNTIDGSFSIVGSGSGNSASGLGSTVPGGYYNAASGRFSFAAGFRAKATTDGTFMWADSRNFDFVPSVDNFFGVRATGGVGFTVAINGTTGAVTQFCNYLPGYSGWSCVSDRDAKENLEPVQGTEVLERVVALPLYTYNFKGADPSLRMLGATAQDFHDAFGLGESRTTIASGNIEGVALAAIQGLNAKVDERAADLQRALEAKDAELAVLRDRVAQLEAAEQRAEALAQRVAELARMVETLGLPRMAELVRPASP